MDKAEELVQKSWKGTAAMFAEDEALTPAPPWARAIQYKVASKLRGNYGDIRPATGHSTTGACTVREREVYVDEMVNILTGKVRRKKRPREKNKESDDNRGKSIAVSYDKKTGTLVETMSGSQVFQKGQNNQLVHPSSHTIVPTRRTPARVPEPKWHAPWKLGTVVSGHLGWVRCCAFEPKNEWFVTGSTDRTIKVWDLAKCSAGAEGGLKLTLTGHINAIRGLAVSPRTTYMFSAGEDKKVLCWDLETNKVIRRYHGHLSGVYSLALHPMLDLLVTGGRDSCARVWDIRTSKQIMMLGGHTHTVGALACNSIDPQVITGSNDSTVKLWDLAMGKAITTLTHHKKGIRDLCLAPFDFSFVTAAADNLKHWQARDGTFLHNYVGHNAIVNAVAVNQDQVLVSGGDDGSLRFWDYTTGYNFFKTNSVVQPGSLECENGIFATTFDKSGSRLITCEADKTIKIWKEDTDADPESHPIDMESWSKFCRTLRRT
mmetsp:Transcript_18105/g.27311  ORF Transcript_18105/g.27311 Transcript_18105/m.27311 type:complete len:489 (+) Transcript_18105:103-1569(+)